MTSAAGRMTTAAEQSRERTPRRTLLWRFNRFLEQHLPDRLYPRSLLIVITPMVALQMIMAFLILERHWDNVTNALSRTIAREVTLVTALYDASPKTPAAARATDRHRQSVAGHGVLDRERARPSGCRRPADVRLRRFETHQISAPAAARGRSPSTLWGKPGSSMSASSSTRSSCCICS